MPSPEVLCGVLAALLAMGATPADPGLRIAEAAGAAQSLQGPLDGRWRLRDRDGHALFDIELSDPADAGAGLVGAWRDTAGREGWIEAARRKEGGLDLALTEVTGGPGAPRSRSYASRAGARCSGPAR